MRDLNIGVRTSLDSVDRTGGKASRSLPAARTGENQGKKWGAGGGVRCLRYQHERGESQRYTPSKSSTVSFVLPPARQYAAMSTASSLQLQRLSLGSSRSKKGATTHESELPKVPPPPLPRLPLSAPAFAAAETAGSSCCAISLTTSTDESIWWGSPREMSAKGGVAQRVWYLWGHYDSVVATSMWGGGGGNKRI